MKKPHISRTFKVAGKVMSLCIINTQNQNIYKMKKKIPSQYSWQQSLISPTQHKVFFFFVSLIAQHKGVAITILQLQIRVSQNPH